MINVLPVTLEGNLVRLEPIGPEHAEGLFTATGGATELWTHMSMHPESIADIDLFIQAALAEQASGSSVPFAIIERTSGEVVGSTRYMDIRSLHSGLEIGWTFLAERVWRTGINTECKYLLLKNAFETCRCERVQLKTDSRNQRSQDAILRIGAKFEGILRKHQLRRDGTLRDTAMFSVIDEEWPAVKTQLEALMGSRRASSGTTNG